MITFALHNAREKRYYIRKFARIGEKCLNSILTPTIRATMRGGSTRHASQTRKKRLFVRVCLSVSPRFLARCAHRACIRDRIIISADRLTATVPPFLLVVGYRCGVRRRTRGRCAKGGKSPGTPSGLRIGEQRSKAASSARK